MKNSISEWAMLVDLLQALHYLAVYNQELLKKN